jgi:DNA-binding PucR family transcriptional regulator
MAKSTKANANKARDAAQAAYENPYVRKLIEDEDLRDNLRSAYSSARSAYGRISNGKGPTKALLDDKKVHKDLKNAADALREASDALREQERSHRFMKLLFIAFVGAVLAMALSEDLRKAVLDRLFGAEEEFEYTSTTAPTPEAAATNAN